MTYLEPPFPRHSLLPHLSQLSFFLVKGCVNILLILILIFVILFPLIFTIFAFEDLWAK